MNICGIDEAGRGSLLGPLVIAGISLKKYEIKKLSSIGVRDSKKLTKKSRIDIYEKIIKLTSNYHIKKLSVGIIDRYVTKHKLNLLEAKYMAKIVSILKPDISYIDSCDINQQRFGNIISKLSNSKIKSYHHADNKFIVVSAASILAKVSRDKVIKLLQKKYDIGSGYPSDLKTCIFVKNCIKNNHLPHFIRTSWKIKNINVI